MLAIKKVIKADEIKNLNIPKEMGEYIEIIILPAKVSQNIDGENFFELITEDGKDIKVPNWTDDEWNHASLYSLFDSEEDEEDWKKTFSVKTRR